MCIKERINLLMFWEIVKFVLIMYVFLNSLFGILIVRGYLYFMFLRMGYEMIVVFFGNWVEYFV